MAPATVGANDYPYAGSTPDVVDRWNFYTRECTSFVAWRLNNDLGLPFTNQYRNPTGNWGNAGHWDDAARSVGIPVDNTPAAGAVAVWDPNVAGAAASRHVAFVMSVNGDGSINVEEYNWTAFAYDQRHISPAGLQFIHFPGSVPTGSAGVLRQFTPAADGTWNAWNLSYGNNMHIAGDPFVAGSSVFVRSTDNTLVQFTPAAGGAWDAWDLSYGNNTHIAGDPYVVDSNVFAQSS